MARSWKGLSTIAGSWIGGGANQTMLEVFGASKSMFAQMIAVDVLLPIYGWGFTLWSSKIR
jgi:uncharacterized membrane protein